MSTPPSLADGSGQGRSPRVIAVAVVVAGELFRGGRGARSQWWACCARVMARGRAGRALGVRACDDAPSETQLVFADC